MERQGGPGEFRREEALMAVATLSVNDARFLNGLRNDLEAALWSYGFDLSPAELRHARRYFASKAGSTDEEIVNALSSDLEQDAEEYARRGFWRFG